MSLIGTRSRKLNESGQGVVEYILILTITVLLIGTFVYQFSQAFRKYANNYFGDYVMCLLESGELPGGAGECKELFTPFDINAGKTSTGGSISNLSGTGGIGSGSGSDGSGSGSGSGSSSSSKNGKNSRNSKSSSKDSGSGGSSSASSGGGSETGVSGSDSSGSGFGKRRSSTPVRSTAGDGPGAGAGKGREGLKPVGTNSSGSGSSSDAGGRGRRTALDRGFGFAGQEEQQQREDERPATKPVAKDEGEGLRPKKVAVDASRKPAAVAEKDSGGFTLGGFLRILLIAGILIAIFVVFGSQLLAITKGGEK